MFRIRVFVFPYAILERLGVGICCGPFVGCEDIEELPDDCRGLRYIHSDMLPITCNAKHADRFTVDLNPALQEVFSTDS